VDSAGGVLGDVANGNYWGAILTSGRAYNTFKDVNLGSLATSELKTGALNSLTGTPNRNTLFNFPSLKTPK